MLDPLRFALESTIDLSDPSVPDYAPAAIYNFERFDLEDAPEMLWQFNVEAGAEVEVRLHFAELFSGIDAVDLRVFDVELEGEVPAAFDDIDQFSIAGPKGAFMRTAETTVSADGILDIEFIHGVENTAIKGIEIIQKGSPVTLDYANFAEVFASDAADPDSTPGNGPAGEDDEATVSVNATAAGQNLVAIALAADGDAAEPADDGQFVVSLEEAAATDTVIDYTVGGSAAAGADYAALSGQATILAGETSATIDVAILDDSEVEDPETVAVTLTGVAGDANVALGGDTLATSTIADDDVPPVSGQALIEVTPEQGLGASTFGGSDAFQITNVSGANIVSISIDLGSGILPDMVFDPTGSGGDATAQVFTPNEASATATGLVPFADNAVDPFSAPRNGGFDVISMNFTDFQAGEIFSFSTDIDPNSIEGVAGAGDAGAVSGYELTGATVTVTFDDGTSQDVVASSLYEDGSLGGSQVVVSTDTALAAPTIALVGGGADESPNLPGDQISVLDGATGQTVQVTGAPGATVSLLQMDARLFIASGDAPFDVQPDEADFYANEATAGKTLYSATLDENGVADIPVTLLAAPSGDATPDGGLNHFVAVLSDGPYAPGQLTSRTSDVLVVREAPGVEVSLAAIADGAEPATNGQFEVSLAEASTVDTVVSYAVQADATATEGDDYTALDGTVTIPAGELSATIDVAVIDDLEIEADETVSIALTGIVESDGLTVLGAADAASVTITSDDVDDNEAPEITSADSFSFVEGAADAVFTATASDADGDDLSFSIAGGDADAFDVDADTGAVSFIETPDFAEGGDNVFEFTLTASDGQAADDQAITVTVLEDSDGDLVPNATDNATFVANPDQRDSNGDGYGNVVDADLNNDGLVGLADLALFRDAFGTVAPITETDPGADADFDGDGSVGLADLATFRDLVGSPPGPSFVDDFV